MASLLERADRLAAYLATWGVHAGQPVAVLLGRGVDSIVALLATLRLGAIWVPLDGDYPDQRLAQILADAAPALIIAEAATRQRLPVEDVPVLLIDRLEAAIAACPGLVTGAAVAPNSPAYLIYTSGSTGQPKGVAVSQGALAAHCAAVVAHYGLDAGDRVLQFASHHVDAALEQILPTLASGACLVMRGGELWSPPVLAEVFARHRVSVADLPPAYLRDVLQAWAEDQLTPPCPRLLIVGGEALTPELVALWRASPLAGARFLNAYGPTEATITATVAEIPPAGYPGNVPIGRPLAGGWVYIVDRDGNPVPEGVVGELIIGGPRVALGYRGHPELSAERFRPEPFAATPGESRVYYSGDLARFIPGSDGLIAFHGRRDHQVKIRGFRIELGEIEARLRGAGAAEAVVLARSRADGEPHLVAYVVAGEEGEAANEAALRRRLAESLPAAMCPASYVFLPRLPMTPGGKLDRRALPSPTMAADVRTPMTFADDITAGLAELWCQLLALPAVTAADDFFHLGGHSLLALQLQGAIRRRFDRTLSLASLLAAPTLDQQADLLREEAVAGAASPLVLLRAGSRGAPLVLRPSGGRRRRVLPGASQPPGQLHGRGPGRGAAGLWPAIPRLGRRGAGG